MLRELELQPAISTQIEMTDVKGLAGPFLFQENQ